MKSRATLQNRLLVSKCQWVLIWSRIIPDKHHIVVSPYSYHFEIPYHHIRIISNTIPIQHSSYRRLTWQYAPFTIGTSSSSLFKSKFGSIVQNRLLHHLLKISSIQNSSTKIMHVKINWSNSCLSFLIDDAYLSSYFRVQRHLSPFCMYREWYFCCTILSISIFLLGFGKSIGKYTHSLFSSAYPLML